MMHNVSSVYRREQIIQCNTTRENNRGRELDRGGERRRAIDDRQDLAQSAVAQICRSLVSYHRVQLLCHCFVVNHHLVHLRNELVNLGRVALAHRPRMPQQV